LTITFNGIQVASGVSLADVPLVATAAFMLVALIVSRRYRQSSIPQWHIVAAYLLLFSGLLAALVGSEGSSADLVTTMRFVVTLFGVPLLIGLAAMTPQRRTVLVEIWLISVVINCVVAVLDRNGTHIGASLSGLSYGGHRQAGLTEHPTHLGYVCALSLPIAVTQILYARGLLYRLLHIGVVVLIAVGMLLAGSRVALVGGGLGILCVPLYTKRTSRDIAVIIVVGAVLLGGAILVSSTSIPSLAEVQGRSGSSIETSNSAHLEGVEAALQLFLSHPLTGAGYSNVRQAQDIYLQLLEGGGIVAVSAFGLFIGGIFRMTKAIRRSSVVSERERGIAVAIATGTLSWLIMGIFQPPIYDRYLYVGPGLLMAMFLSAQSSVVVSSGRRQLSAGRASRGTTASV
jgi:hypothetical protein